MANLFEELKRRNVVRVAIAYLTGAWLLAQRRNELTGEGLKTEAEVESDPTLRRVPARYFDFTIIALLVIALGYFFWESRLRDDAPADEEVLSVAVMPFDDLNSARDQAWFAAGMTDELMSELVRIPDFAVVGRRTVAAFDPSRQSLEQFAEKIEVSHVEELKRQSFVRVTIVVSSMHFFIPGDWDELPGVAAALDKPGLRELFGLRRSFVEAGSGRRDQADNHH